MSLTQKRFLEKYGEVKVKFSSYFKYSFSFVGVIDEDSVIYVSVGGSSDDIYRLYISANREILIKDLDVSYASIQKGKELIEEYIECW